MSGPEYPSSDDMLREFRATASTPPDVAVPDAPAGESLPVSADPAPPAPPATPPAKGTGDPFRGRPAREPYDPQTAPATGDDRHAEWKPRGRAGVPTQERARSWFSKLRPLLIIAVIGAFAFGNLSSLFDSRTAVESLSVGDCFNDPGLDADFVEKVDTVDCAEPHDFELFALPRYTATDEWPGEATLFDWADEQCWDAFEGYVGTPFEESELYFANMVPTEESWDQGDRGANCMLMRLGPDFEIVPSTGSFRNSGI